MSGSAAANYPEPEALLEIARAAAQAGARELTARSGKVSVLRSKSSPTDPVTEADEAAEEAIRSVLLEASSGSTILGEEGGATSGAGELRWVIDPLDGTVNYLYGYPQWCISIGVDDSLGPAAGLVLDVARGEEFSAVRGGPPMLDGVPFERTPVHSPGDGDPLEGVLLATGFHYETASRVAQARAFAGLIPRVRDIRRAGSAALDLCWTAIGRVDAYGEHGVHEWDIAAGALICVAAGLDVSLMPECDGRPVGVIAGEPRVVAELAEAWGGAGLRRSWPGQRIG